MLIEIPDSVVENWRDVLPVMEEMYSDTNRDDWWEADDIARSVAEELMGYLPVD